MPVKVRDAIRRIEAAGWELARTRGSTLHPKTWASIIRQAGLEDER